MPLYSHITWCHILQRTLWTGIIVALAGVWPCTTAQAQNDRGRTDWSMFVDHEARSATSSSGREARLATAPAPHYYLLPVTEVRGNDQLPFTVVRRLDRHHAIVRYRQTARIPARARPANARWKLSPALLARPASDPKQAAGQFVLQGPDYAALRQRLISLNVTIVSEYPRTGTCTVAADYEMLYQRLLPLPELTFVSETTPARYEEGVISDANLHVNRINQLHHRFPDLSGTGLTVSLKEAAYDPDDIDLRGRHQPSPAAASEVTPHATTMATLLAGAGNTGPTSRGVAWGTQLTSASFDTLFPSTDYQALSVSVQNHSYGTQVEGFYGAEAQAYDLSTHDHPTLLHVFSVGNSGQQTDSLGPYRAVPRFANLTGNYKQAKNVLTVGAVSAQLTIDSLISRGPAHDGRIKPELMAYSTEGSSGAAALVSGTAALLQQAYQQLHDTLPPSALLRAVLLNSAQDVAQLGPDYRSGYGNLDAYRAVRTIHDQRHYTTTVADRREATLTITVPARAHHLRVTAAWNDPAAEPNSSPALVNDLDLHLVHEASGQRWLPWVLSSYPHPDSLQQPARRGTDRLNPAEQITVEHPPEGTYRIQLAGTRVSGEAQPVYVAVQWDTTEQFSWTSPTGSDHLPQDGVTPGAFRWTSTYEQGTTGTLAVSLDGGQSWQTVDEAVDLSASYYAWEPPPVFTTAQARMTVGDTTYLSDRFTISRSLRPTVGFQCGDSALVQWPRVPEAAGYTLYALGERYLEAVAVVDDTLATVRPPAGASWYAVAPRLAHGEGVRSGSVDAQGGGVPCYVASFLAGLNERSEVNLLLDLSTTYQIDWVQFERWDGRAFRPLTRTRNVSRRPLQEYVDRAAAQGYNLYRARLLLNNGVEVVTDSAAAYYLTDQPTLVFPNPVRPSQPLNVYTRVTNEENATITIYNQLGQAVLTQSLLTERDVVATEGLLPGLYPYVISVGGERFRGQVVVR